MSDSKAQVKALNWVLFNLSKREVQVGGVPSNIPHAQGYVSAQVIQITLLLSAGVLDAGNLLQIL